MRSSTAINWKIDRDNPLQLVRQSQNPPTIKLDPRKNKNKEKNEQEKLLVVCERNLSYSLYASILCDGIYIYTLSSV